MENAMPSQSTGLKPQRRSSVVPSSAAGTPGRLSSQAQQWMARLGMLAALCTANPAHAQADASRRADRAGQLLADPWAAPTSPRKAGEAARVDPNSADALYGMSQVELARSNADAARRMDRPPAHRAPDRRPPGALAAGSQQAGGQQSDAAARPRCGAAPAAAPKRSSSTAAIFDNRPPPDALALEYYQLLGGTPQGGTKAARARAAREGPAGQRSATGWRWRS
jgi:hypothetical protein